MTNKVHGRASACALGVLLVVLETWSGKLLRQSLYKWSLLSQLGPEGRKASFMSFFKKPGKPAIPVVGGDDDRIPVCLKERSPTLGHFLCSPCWPDGEARQLSSLVVFVEDGIFKACLSDKDSSNVLWSSAKCWDDLLEALEARLTDDVPDWRKSRNRKK